MLERYKVVRRLVLLWVLALVTYATVKVFGYKVQATEEYLGLLGLLSVAVGFYTTWRGKHEVRGDSDSGFGGDS